MTLGPFRATPLRSAQREIVLARHARRERDLSPIARMRTFERGWLDGIPIPLDAVVVVGPRRGHLALIERGQGTVGSRVPSPMRRPSSAPSRWSSVRHS